MAFIFVGTNQIGLDTDHIETIDLRKYTLRMVSGQDIKLPPADMSRIIDIKKGAN